MANELNTNPMVIDTAGVIYANHLPYTIKRVSFQASSDDNDVRLADTAGNTIWQAKAGDVSVNGYNYSEKLDYAGNSGLNCTVIDDTAVLLIYS